MVGLLAVLAVALSMMVLACGDGDGDEGAAPTETAPGEAPTANGSPSPAGPEPMSTSAEPPVHPDGVRTGDAFVDAYLEARELGDADAITGMLAFVEMECSAQPAIGSVPCREGEADGSAVDVIRAGGSCEPVFTRPDEVRAIIEGQLLDASHGLYGVVESDGRFHLIYAAAASDTTHGVFFVSLEAEIGEVVAIGSPCGESAESFFELLVSEGGNVLLAAPQ